MYYFTLLLLLDHEVLDFEGFCILAAQHITQAASELIICVHVTSGPGNNPACCLAKVTFLSFSDCSASESLLLNRQTRVATLPDIDNATSNFLMTMCHIVFVLVTCHVGSGMFFPKKIHSDVHAQRRLQ